MMRSIAVLFSACLINCASALPTSTNEEPSLPIFNDPSVNNIEDISPLSRAIKLDDAAEWSNKVVGGSPASNGQFPYMVSLRRTNSHFCGASIISATYLLTAAHCTEGVSASSITATVGTTTLNSGGIGYALDRIVIHDGYISLSGNDISLLRTSSPISGSSIIASIPLNSAALGSGFTVTLSGWGATVYEGSYPNDLQFINLRTISNTDCAQYHGMGLIFETHVCTLTEVGEGACNGDSGGPLVYNGALVGVVAWGKPCGVGYPDVFTRVSSYVDWILSNAT